MSPLEHFTQTSRPYLDLFPPNSCIEQTRILVEVMRRFKVKAEPIATALRVSCPELKVGFVSGLSKKEEKSTRKLAKNFVDLTDPASPRDVGHIIAIVGDKLVDPTLYQVSQPQHGFVIDPQVVCIGPVAPGQMRKRGNCTLAEFTTETGHKVKVNWTVTGKRGFERTDAWEPSHLWGIIDQITHGMILRGAADDD